MKKIIFILLILVFSYSNCIYFLISKSSKKCFFEEFYQDSIISLMYNTLEEIHEDKEHEHNPIYIFSLYNLDKDELVDSLSGTNFSGKVNFVIKDNASYSICVIPRENAVVFEHLEILKLSITIDPHDENLIEKDLSNVPKNKDFEKINAKVDKLQKKIIDIMRTQNYQIFKEDEFINNQMANSSAIVYMTVLQILILLILTIWQVSSFKNLFKDQIPII